MKCDYCNGTGKTTTLLNPECHFDGLETPQYEDEGCEECGGTGIKQTDDIWCNECGSSNVDSDEAKVTCKKLWAY